MPYQNNNNRITPQVNQGLIKITPTAQITDQLIRPQITIAEHNEIANRANFANSLVNIGKGIGEAETAFKQSAQATAGEMILQDEIDKNTQHDYKQAAEKLPFLSRINPYVQQSYNELSVKDWTQSIKNGFLADPNLTALEPKDFNAKFDSAMQELKDRCRANNISTSIAGKEMAAFYAEMNDIRGKYVINHEVYKTELGYNKQAQQLSKQMQAAIISGKKDDQYANISTLMNIAISNNQSVPSDVMFTKIITPAVYSAVKNLDDEEYLDIAQFKKAVLDSMSAHGLNIETFDLEFDSKIDDLVRAARRQKIQDKNDERREKEQAEKDKSDKITTEIMQKFVKNEFKTTKAAQAYLNQRVQEEGIEGELPILLQKIVAYDNLTSNISDVSEEEKEPIFNTLDNLMAQGELSLNVINQAGSKLSAKELRPYFSAYLSQQNHKAAVIRQEQQFNRQLMQNDINYEKGNVQAGMKNFKAIFGNSDMQKVLKTTMSHQTGTPLFDTYKNLETYFNSRYAQAKTPEDFRRVNREIEEGIANLNFMLNAKPTQLPKQRIAGEIYNNIQNTWKVTTSDSNPERDSVIFTAAGIVSTPFNFSGKRTPVNVVNQTTRGQTSMYELDIPKGTALRLPRGSGGGTLINAGYTHENGYFMDIKLNNTGATMRIENMQEFNVTQMQSQIDKAQYFPNQMIGRAGERVRMRFINANNNGWETATSALGSVDRNGNLIAPIKNRK